MTERARVSAAQGEYLAACSELPVTAVAADDPAGAVVVVTGAGDWMARASDTSSAGARAVIVSRPHPGDVVAPEGGDAGVPLVLDHLVLDRPRVRADAIAEVQKNLTSPPAAVIIDCVDSGEHHAMLLDALAWARVLLGGPLQPVRAHPGTVGVVALLEREGSVVSVTAVRGDRSSVRVQTVGPVRVEIVFGDDTRDVRISVEDASGLRHVARRFETPERLSLRRAIRAVAGGAVASDAADFADDVRALRSIIHGL